MAIKGTGRRLNSVRSQWTVERSIRSKKAQNWFLFHECEEDHQVEAWMKGGTLYWKWSMSSPNRDGKIHKCGKPYIAHLIRTLNGTNKETVAA